MNENTRCANIVAVPESIHHIHHIAPRILGFVNLLDKQEEKLTNLETKINILFLIKLFAVVEFRDAKNTKNINTLFNVGLFFLI